MTDISSAVSDKYANLIVSIVNLSTYIVPGFQAWAIFVYNATFLSRTCSKHVEHVETVSINMPLQCSCGSLCIRYSSVSDSTLILT